MYAANFLAQYPEKLLELLISENCCIGSWKLEVEEVYTNQAKSNKAGMHVAEIGNMHTSKQRNLYKLASPTHTQHE